MFTKRTYYCNPTKPYNHPFIIHPTKHAIKHPIKHAIKHPMKHPMKHPIKHAMKHPMNHPIKHPINKNTRGTRCWSASPWNAMTSPWTASPRRREIFRHSKMVISGAKNGDFNGDLNGKSYDFMRNHGKLVIYKKKEIIWRFTRQRDGDVVFWFF